MPNWCNNTVEIHHADFAMIERARKAFNEGALLQEFFPCPAELDIVAGYVGADDSPEQMALVAQEQANIAKYGFKNWYDWKVANWGTKWDVGADGIEAEDIPGDRLVLNFDSAWSPPIGAYERLVELGFSVRAMYYEPGMAFAGIWQDGSDDYYEYGGMSSEQVEEELPEDLNEMFNISEEIAQYEEEENQDN